ncbi:MAG: hypothetical protein DCC73_11970 [Proteobacteria bacterium]|nr:MAG: hypothetical protein DCC73_11970 [Pseudomonadota bacterium]
MTHDAPTKPAPRDGNGFLLASDGLPQSPHARAAALAAKGKKTDPLGLVGDDLIAGYAPAKPALEKE